MRATDVVRMTLDLIDIIDKPEPKIEVQVATDEPEEEQRFASVFKCFKQDSQANTETHQTK